MRIWQVVMGVALLALIGCAGTPGPGTAGASTASNEAGQVVAQNDSADNDQGLICRQEQVTGTRISERVCTTREQRRAAAESSRDAVTNIGIGATQAGGLREGG